MKKIGDLFRQIISWLGKLVALKASREAVAPKEPPVDWTAGPAVESVGIPEESGEPAPISEKEKKREDFEEMFGFAPGSLREWSPLSSWHDRKAHNIVWQVLVSLARAWKLACWREEDIDRDIKSDLPVFSEDNPLLAKMKKAKIAVVETSGRFHSAVCLAEEMGYIFPGKAGPPARSPWEFLNKEEEEALRAIYEAKKVAS